MNIIDRKLSEIAKGRLSRKPIKECKNAGKEGHIEKAANGSLAFPNAITIGLILLSGLIIFAPTASIGFKVGFLFFSLAYILMIRYIWIFGRVRHATYLENRAKVSNE